MKWTFTVASLAFVVLLSGCNLEERDANKVEARAEPQPTVTVLVTPSPSPSPPKEEEVADCPDSWEISQADPGQGRWFANGIGAIRRADTKQEARDAAERWLSRVKHDPQLLAGAVVYYLDKQVSPAKLRKGDCASGKAVTLVNAIELAFAEARIAPDEAPTNGRNSGTIPGTAGTVAAMPYSGISGERKAVRVTLKDGTTTWLMARCGNVVTLGPPPLGLPVKDYRLSVMYNDDVPEQVRGPGAGGEPAADGENKPSNVNPETGCQGSCNGQGTEPKPPKDDPPPPETSDPDDQDGQGDEPANDGDDGGW